MKKTTPELRHETTLLRTRKKKDIPKGNLKNEAKCEGEIYSVAMFGSQHLIYTLSPQRSAKSIFLLRKHWYPLDSMLKKSMHSMPIYASSQCGKRFKRSCNSPFLSRFGRLHIMSLGLPFVVQHNIEFNCFANLTSRDSPGRTENIHSIFALGLLTMNESILAEH